MIPTKFGRIVAASAPIAMNCMPSATAAEYPQGPIRMVVGFAAGGGTSNAARPLAQKLTALMGVPVVVDNRPGAASNIATKIVAEAAPDGHTILMGTIAALAINPSLYGNLSFDPVKDFAPVSLVYTNGNVLVTHPSVPVKSVKELIALAKSRPGELNYGSSGLGGPSHLSGVLFDQLAGTKLTHVPYKGGGPMMTELVGGHLQIAFASISTAVPQINAGRIRALAITTAKRSTLIPQIPTIAESGVPGFDLDSWGGVVVPVKTSKAIIVKLNSSITAALNEQSLKDHFASEGMEPIPSTPNQFGAYMKSELDRWGKLIKAAGVTAN